MVGFPPGEISKFPRCLNQITLEKYLHHSTFWTPSDRGVWSSVKTNAPRIAVIGGGALVAVAFALGYYLGRPHLLPASASADQVSSAVRAALLEPDQLERASELAPILASLNAQNLEAVVGVYESTLTSGGPGPVAMEMLAEAWSKLDPAGAFQRIQGWEYYRITALPLLVRSWARHDRASARAAVESLEVLSRTERDNVYEAVILGWADSGDPAIWDAYVAGQPFGSNAAYVLMQRIAASEGGVALLRRAESLPEDAPGRFRPLALRYAADIAAETDPERAAEFAERNRGWMEGGLQWVVANRWAMSDAPRATQWALTQPEGPAREQALRAAFRKWLASDERAAIAWAQAQPEEVLAPVLGLYARVLGKSDPKRAMEISADLADPAERLRTQRVVAKRWLAREPKIATDWLKQNDLEDLIAKRRRPDPGPPPGPTAAQPEGGKGDR